MEKQWHMENPLNCPMVRAINAIGGKWKPILLHLLAEDTRRFGELRKKIPPITQKMLTQQLRELKADGLVNRKVFAEVPPHVEYSLTARGRNLSPILEELYQWGEALPA